MPRIARRCLRKAFRFYLRVRYRKIWTKLTAILLLAVNLPVLALCLLLIENSRKAVTSSVLGNHAAIAGRVAEEIRDFIKIPENILRASASDIAAIGLDPWRQETFLVNQVLNYPYFLRVYSVGSDGAVIACSDTHTGRISPALADDSLASFRERRVIISTIRDVNSRSPYISIYVPIIALGQPKGVLVGDIDIRSLWRAIDEIRLGETGNILIFSSDGMLVASRDKKRVFADREGGIDPDVQSALSGQKGSLSLAVEGRRWISSFAPISGFGAVVLRQAESEALSFNQVMRRQSLMMLLMVELVVIGLSIFLARRLSRPVEAVIAHLNEVSRGNLESKIRLRRFDEIGRMFKAFNGMTEKLRKMKQMERFSTIGEASACIAHEFKNSMVAMKSFVKLFPRKHSDPEFAEMFGRMVPEELKRWERMLTELSDFSSVDCLVRNRTGVSAVIENVLKMLGQEIKDKGITVTCEPLENVYIMADEERLFQVVMNIVLNAVQAMPEGGCLTIREKICAGEKGRAMLRVSIGDTGKGIPAGVIEKIFEPFHSNKSGSLGLGLAISRRIIENHRGRISVESRKNAGTVFTFELPLE